MKSELQTRFNELCEKHELHNYALVAVNLDGFSHMVVLVDTRIKNPRRSDAIVLSYSAYYGGIPNRYPSSYDKFKPVAHDLLKDYPHYAYKGNPLSVYLIDLPK